MSLQLDSNDGPSAEQRRACEDALVEWLEESRLRWLRAARAVGLGGTVEAERRVVTELTDSVARSETRRQQVNPLLLPRLAWTIGDELLDPDGVPPVAEHLYRTYGQRCEINAGLPPVHFTEAPTEWISRVLLQSLRWHYLRSLASLDHAEPERAIEFALKLLTLIEGDMLVSLTLLPLAGLRVSTPLSSGDVVLRPITLVEYRDLQGDDLFRIEEAVLWHARRFEPHDERVILEVREARPKRDRDSGNITRTRRMILAMQLLGFAPKGRAQAVTVTEPFRMAGTRSSPVSVAGHGPDRSIVQADLDAVVELAERIPAGALGMAETHEEIAFARFQTAVVERNPSDAIVDYVIALEAVFLQGVRDELRFRFALYGAWFLGTDRTDRQRLFDELKQLYDARSEIVHGSVRKPHELEALAGLARRVSSAALLRALREGWPTAKVLADAPLG